MQMTAVELFRKAPDAETGRRDVSTRIAVESRAPALPATCAVSERDES